MTIREFQVKAEEHMEPGEYVSCIVEMSHGSIRFTIWSGGVAKHFYGDSPEAALELYRCRRLDKAPIDMEITEEVPPPLPKDVAEEILPDYPPVQEDHALSDPFKDMPF